MRLPTKLAVLLTTAAVLGPLMPTATGHQTAARPERGLRITALEPLTGDIAFGSSISERGVVSGTSSAEGGVTHAVIWRNGRATDLGTLGGPGSSSAVLWPNKASSGVVVGISQTDEVDPNNESWSCGFFLPARPGRTCVGVVWKDGDMLALPTLGGPNGFATGANNRGQVVGWAENTVQDGTCAEGQVQQFRAVRWDRLGARTTELLPFGDDSVSAATGINDAGRVIGISGDCDQAVGRLSARHALVWDHGRAMRLRDLGGIAWNTPMSINDRGDVVGFVNRSADDGQDLRPMPVLWTSSGRLHELDLPVGFTFGQALGINAHRQVVGVAYSADFARCTAMLWHDGHAVDLQTRLPSRSWSLCSANDINARGQITGQGTQLASGRDIGFLLDRVTR